MTIRHLSECYTNILSKFPMEALSLGRVLSYFIFTIYCIYYNYPSFTFSKYIQSEKNEDIEV